MTRLLLITYYFPPCGGAPVQRWLRLLPHLVNRGCEITVITTQEGDYPFIDKSLIQRIPESVKVIRTPVYNTSRLWKLIFGSGSNQPYGTLSSQNMSFIHKILLWTRLNIIIPDIRIIWNPSAYKAAAEEIKAGVYDAIITTGPPHSTHFVGMRLKKNLHVPWIADFRDPFREIHYLNLANPSLLTRQIYRKLEIKLVAAADLVLTVSESIKKRLPDGNKVVIFNAYEPQDFSGFSYLESPMFRVKYVGQITAGQDFRLITEFARKVCDLSGYDLTFIGTRLNSQQQNQLSTTHKDRIRITGFVAHDQAVKELVDADALLLIVNDTIGSSGILTTKLFEYLASRTLILCISPVMGEAARIIEQCGAGKVFTYKQIDDAIAWIASLTKGTKHDGNIDPYSVEYQADKLIDEFNRLNMH